MTPRRLFKILVLVFTLASSRVMAEPLPLPDGHVKLTSGPADLTTLNGTHYTVPVGSHILDGTSWAKLDTETKRLQDAETRHNAELKSLKAAISKDTPGWGTALVMLVVVSAISGVGYYTQTH